MVNPLVVSSIKGNIGHCESASGAAGLAKLLLMLHEKKIPVQVGFKDVNPRFADLESSASLYQGRLQHGSTRKEPQGELC